MAKTKSYEWIPRAIMHSPFSYALCTTEKGFKKFLKDIKLPKNKHPSFLDDQFDGCVYTFDSGNGGRICVVNIRNFEERDPHEIAGIIVHEGVHIWQEVRNHIQELEPSAEFEAYSVQAIVQNLMESFERQTTKKTKKGKK